MRKFLNGHTSLIRKVALEKARMAQEIVQDKQVYVETNHCFIKGFGWFITESVPEERIGVIILKRDPSKIAKSTLRIGCSPLEPDGWRWVITPDIRSPLVPPPSPFLSRHVSFYLACTIKFIVRCARYLVRVGFGKEFPFPRRLTNYEITCLEWYVEETAAREKLYREKFPSMRYFEVDIEELNSREKVTEMMEFFGCQEKESISDIIGVRTNLKSWTAK